ncbi:alpha/beta fold hydrolase [Niveibacterium sp. SC-1]|uniref:alpha/beta fold hydrolase n=1 Tax=Niveibacterium sp. SC-1 TaxID=3135646 RepID=UPI00311F6E11
MAAKRSTFVICARNVGADNQFGGEPAEISFLRVPAGKDRYDAGLAMKADSWRKYLMAAADGEEDELTGLRGNILVFIHGYNNDIPTIVWRTRKLQETLDDAGWKGVVVAFDWPCENSTLNYLEDRSDAASVADKLVSDVIPMLVSAPDAACVLNVHLIGHSTGAYVIQEAFSRATTKGELFRAEWRIAQVVLIGGDIAADSLDASSQWSGPMFDRIVRLTNYQNRHDSVLGVSNAKRLGTSPRVGRVGLTAQAHSKCVNVDCTHYFEGKDPTHSDFQGTFCHSWHIGDPTFALDLALTLEADIDRLALPTRARGIDGLALQPGLRPQFQSQWLAAAPPLVVG